MLALEATPRVTVAQYLAIERDSPVRHEYLDGYMYAMAGGTQAHSIIEINAGTLLRQALRGGPCRVYSSNMKIRLGPERFVYPDVSVGCDPADRDDAADWIGAPRLVVEVLSPSTAAYDRGLKFALYREVAALREYVLVETERRRVAVYHREEGGDWAPQPTLAGDGAAIALPSLGLRLAVADLYEDTDIPAERDET
jgi:Uma2 family endonuclease